MAQVRVGGTLYDENQMFTFNSGYGGSYQLNAAQAANQIQQSGYQGNGGLWYDAGGDTAGGDIRVSGEIIKPKAPAPSAPAPPRPSAPRSVLSPATPPPPPLDQSVTQQERDEVTKPAKGLENTIKTTPTLLREKRRKSYLTAGG